MINLDELINLREAATPGPWEHKIDDAFTTIHTIEPSVASYVSPADAAYIVAACNAIPELVARIRELEDQLDVNEMRMKKAGDVFADLLKAMHKITDTKENEEGIPFKQVSALETCRIVSNNNSTPPEWLMRRFTEVK